MARSNVHHLTRVDTFFLLVPKGSDKVGQAPNVADVACGLSDPASNRLKSDTQTIIGAANQQACIEAIDPLALGQEASEKLASRGKLNLLAKVDKWTPVKLNSDHESRAKAVRANVPHHRSTRCECA